MAVTPVNPPVPPNSDYARATFVWGTTDEITNDTNKQNLLNWCRDRGTNVVFLDIWRFLGGSNWSVTNANNIAEFIDAAHKSGMQVYALAGDLPWGTSQDWVMKNIVQPLVKYQALYNTSFPKSLFDGVIFDVEYWTDESTYPPATYLPKLLDLMKAVRNRVQVPVGLFAPWFLKDAGGTSPRPSLTYNGKSAQDGEHMMDVLDFVVVGAYRDTANDNAGNGQPGIITISQPWIDYANDEGKNFAVWVGVETINVSPSYVTFYGQTRTFMEGELTTVSSSLKGTSHSAYVGAVIHDYNGHKAMAA